MKIKDKDRYSDEVVLQVVGMLRAARSHLEWIRATAYIMRECGASEAAATRLVWGLATGYRQPPEGLPAPGANLTYGEEYSVKLYLKNFQNDINNAAAFLGISVEAYRQHMERIRAQGRPGLMDNV